jgi:hypothetical protein
LLLLLLLLLVLLVLAAAAAEDAEEGEEEEEGRLSFPWWSLPSFASFLGLGVLGGRVVRGMAGEM